jgi:hypothetical protein
MTTPANPSNQKPAAAQRDPVAADENIKALTFEDTLHQIWARNRKLVFAFLAVVALLILGKGGWEYLQQKKDLEVSQAYGAATNADQLKAFAAAHPDHVLAGVAQLRIADEAYAAGKAADAIAGYEKALAAIKDGPLAARAQLGRAMAKVQAGKSAEAANELKQIASSTTLPGATRAEATYQLASLAAEAGNGAEVAKYVDDLMKIEDAGQSWMQRGMMLRMTTPVAATPAVTPPAAQATPAPATPSAPAPKQDAPKSDMQVKLPGK